MKKISKGDVADIVLVYAGMLFLLRFISTIVVLLHSLAFYGVRFGNSGAQITVQLAQLGAIGAVTFVLLFARPALIRRLFPDSEDAQIELSDGLLVLAKYTFWIRLLGMVTFLQSFISFIGQSADVLTSIHRLSFGSFWWVKIAIELASMVAAVFIVWKANWISEQLENLGPSRGQSRHDDALPLG